MKASKNRFGLIVVISICLAGVGALAYYVKNAPAQSIDYSDLKPEYAAKRDKEQGLSTPNPRINSNEDLEFHGKPANPPSSADSKLFVVNEFLAKLETAKPLHADSITMDQRVARIEFPAGSDFNLGSRDEATFLLGLRSALGQFAEVDAVEIYVGGQRLDELGHEVIDGPMPVVRPENWKNPTKRAAAPGPSEGN